MLENHPLDSHFANKSGVAAAVLEFVKFGGKQLLNVKDSVCSRSPLHMAALCDNHAFIEAACSQGADVDQVDLMLSCAIVCLISFHSLFPVGFSLVVSSAHCGCQWQSGSCKGAD